MGTGRPSEAKITDLIITIKGVIKRFSPTCRPYLEIAVRIQQEIGGFEITMQYVRRMESFQSPERLIEIKNISSPPSQWREETHCT
jgi:hypothetical protein